MRPRRGSLAPFIGSVEGIANTPAYRGIALALFEDLELAEFGNRIPFLTFEIEADEEPPTVGTVLSDASNSSITAGTDRTLVGYAAYGRSIKEAIKPLVDSFGVDLFDDGEVLRPPTPGVPLPIAADELGNRAEQQPVPRFHREQSPVRAVPAALRVTYYDPARDYQTGEASERGRTVGRREAAGPAGCIHCRRRESAGAGNAGACMVVARPADIAPAAGKDDVGAGQRGRPAAQPAPLETRDSHDRRFRSRH